MSIDVICSCGWTKAVKDDCAREETRCPRCSQMLTIPQPADLETAAAAALMEVEPTTRLDRPTEEELSPAKGEYAMDEAPPPIRTAIPSKAARPVKRRRPEKDAQERQPWIVLTPRVATVFAMIIVGGILIAIGPIGDRLLLSVVGLVCLVLFKLITNLLSHKEE